MIAGLSASPAKQLLVMFQRAPTALHVPCIGLPGFVGSTGMPMGVQLIGPRYSDADLLELAVPASEALGTPMVDPVDPREANT